MSGWSSPRIRRRRVRVSSSRCAGLLVLAQSVRSTARLLAEVRVSGWSSPRTRRRRVRVSSSRARACSCSPSARRSAARLLAEARVSGWSSPRTRRRRVRVSSSRARAARARPASRRSAARLLAEVRVSGWSSPRTRRRRVRVSSSRCAGLLVLAQRAQVGGEVVGRGEGVGVVVAEDPAAAGEGVLVELRGPARTRPARAGRRRGCWPRSGCRGGRRRGPGGGGSRVSSSSARACCVLAQRRDRSRARLLAAARVSGWSSPSRCRSSCVGLLEQRQGGPRLAAGRR